MSILVDKSTKLLVQGITGREGLFHTARMIEHGTSVVAGVTPQKGGEWVMGGKVPVFDTVKSAVEATGANTSVIFVPSRFSADAILEAADAGISLIVCITEGIPVQDMMKVRRYLDQMGARLVGPNCPGLLSPGTAKVGIIPGDIAIAGNIGVVSRSGTLTYEVLHALKQNEMGVSTCVGIGGDPINGTSFVDTLELFEADPHTFIAGKTAPPGKRMGHAGAIVEGGEGTAEDKIKALSAAGVMTADHPEEIPGLLQ